MLVWRLSIEEESMVKTTHMQTIQLKQLVEIASPSRNNLFYEAMVHPGKETEHTQARRIIEQRAMRSKIMYTEPAYN